MEVINLNYAVTMKAHGDNLVDVKFVNGNIRSLHFKTPEEAQQLLKNFEALVVFGDEKVSKAFVVYEGDLLEKL
jgi:hypothetical protein